MALEQIPGLMGIYIQVNIKMIKKKDMVFLHGKKANFMKVKN